MRAERTIAFPAGSALVEIEIAPSVDPRGGLFGYTEAVGAVADPLRAAVVEGALDGQRQAVADGRLGPVDEVWILALRIEGHVDAPSLRDAVRQLVLDLAAPGDRPAV